MIDPPIKTNNPLAKLNPPKNRKPVNTSVIRGVDKRGSFTDTNVSQADDLYPGASAASAGKRPVNAWWNSLTPAQKAAHNIKKRVELEASTPAVTVPGYKTSNRVYDPVKEAAQKRMHWTAENTNMTFGGRTVRGITSDPKEIASGYAKVKADSFSPNGKDNTYEARPFTDKETLLWNSNKMGPSANPIGRDTIGRGARQDKMIALMNSKKPSSMMQPTSPVVSREKGGVIVNGKIMRPKPVIVAKGAKIVHKSGDGGCGCGGDMMQKGGPVGRVGRGSSNIRPSSAKTRVESSFTTKKRLDEEAKSGKKSDGDSNPKGATYMKSKEETMPAKPVTKTNTTRRVFAAGGEVPNIDEESPIRR